MPPAQPKIYHITHLDNLVSIIESGYLYADATVEIGSISHHNIGMNEIKRRRMTMLQVGCHPGTYVGEYVPFYFCPRSIMLYVLYRGNQPGLNYRGGQQPILHLKLDLQSVVQYCDEHNCRWAFSDRNAGSTYAQFYNRLADLDRINWNAVRATDFRDVAIKDGKQAECLVHQSVPWTLVEEIGIIDNSIAQQVADRLKSSEYLPFVRVRRNWYY